MVSWLLQFDLDAVLFAALAGLVALAVHRWLRRVTPSGLPGMWRAAVVCVAAVTVLRALLEGEDERAQLRERLEGLAPTYAQEISLLGHARLKLDTPDTDSAYQAVLQAQVRWERVNPHVSDIYTLRRDPAGRVVFVVDSETDYNRNGRFDDAREQRTPVGEVYDEASPTLISALNGRAGFDDVPVTDRWGTWVSAYVPLMTPDGQIDGAVGVDYDASLWNNDILRARATVFGLGGMMMMIVLACGAIVTVTRSESDKRQQLQQQLVDASRQAGMAEVATGVLHNVGNVLNSVNVAATMLREKVRASKLSGLNKAADMIQSHRENVGEFLTADARGKLLPDYLVKISGALAHEQAEMLDELAGLTRSVEHIKQIVASQQSMAKTVKLNETFEVADLLEDALRLCGNDIQKADVQVKRDSLACPPLTTDRHALLQIMVNLVSNAAKAMRECPVRQLTLGVATAEEAGQLTARISVGDTGVGIPSEAVGQLFTHGFTTRADGHGFGLHHSANAAHNLGGRISVHSDGLGRGAIFTVCLPLVVSMKGVPCPA